MKGFLVLLCAIVAVQARSAVLKTAPRDASASSSPWLVHLRLAHANSGVLHTCAGSLIDNRWVLTTADCLRNARFSWVRYGAENVVNPELVTESSTFTVHPGYNAFTGANNFGVISINRFVQFTDKIASVPLNLEATLQESSTFCGFGEQDGAPGAARVCYGVSLEQKDDEIVASRDDQISQWDLGAPLVINGEQVAVLTTPARNGQPAKFTKPDIAWLKSVTGVDL